MVRGTELITLHRGQHYIEPRKWSLGSQKQPKDQCYHLRSPKSISQDTCPLGSAAWHKASNWETEKVEGRCEGAFLAVGLSHVLV